MELESWPRFATRFPTPVFAGLSWPGVRSQGPAAVIGRTLWNVSRHSTYDADNDTSNGRAGVPSASFTAGL